MDNEFVLKDKAMNPLLYISFKSQRARSKCDILKIMRNTCRLDSLEEVTMTKSACNYGHVNNKPLRTLKDGDFFVREWPEKYEKHQNILENNVSEMLSFMEYVSADVRIDIEWLRESGGFLNIHNSWKNTAKKRYLYRMRHVNQRTVWHYGHVTEGSLDE